MREVEAANSSRPGLALRALAAIGANFAGSSAAKLFTVLSTIVLAHLLTPFDFGIANIGLLALMVLLPLTDIGIAQVLVRGRVIDSVKRQALTAFWIVILLALALYSLLWASAGLLATLYGRREIEAMLRVIGLAVILYSLSRVPSALLERELRYMRKAIPEVVGSFAYGIVAIALALFHFGFWSIVGASIARSAVVGVGVFALAGWRPGLLFEMSVAQQLIAYARVLMAASTLRLVYTNIDNAIVGKVVGLPALGYYAMAYNLGNLAPVQIAGSIGTVLFPTYSRMLPDTARVKRALLLTLRYLSMLMSPVTTCGIVASPFLVPLVMGDKWTPMTGALQALLVYGWMRTMAPAYSALMLASGLNRISLQINLSSLVLGLVAAVPVAVRFGFVGIAVEFTLLEVLRLGWMMVAARSHFSIAVGSQLAALGPGLAGGLLAGTVLAVLVLAVSPSNIPGLALELAAASLAYLLYNVARGEFSPRRISAVREMYARRQASM